MPPRHARPPLTGTLPDITHLDHPIRHTSQRSASSGASAWRARWRRRPDRSFYGLAGRGDHGRAADDRPAGDRLADDVRDPDVIECGRLQFALDPQGQLVPADVQRPELGIYPQERGVAGTAALDRPGAGDQGAGAELADAGV